jgi:hypothetical protein
LANHCFGEEDFPWNNERMHTLVGDTFTKHPLLVCTCDPFAIGHEMGCIYFKKK